MYYHPPQPFYSQIFLLNLPVSFHYLVGASTSGTKVPSTPRPEEIDDLVLTFPPSVPSGTFRRPSLKCRFVATTRTVVTASRPSRRTFLSTYTSPLFTGRPWEPVEVHLEWRDLVVIGGLPSPKWRGGFRMCLSVTQSSLGLVGPFTSRVTFVQLRSC